MREIVADTETTGFSVKNGDRIIEIGLIETVDFVPTGRVFHEFINPERDIHWAASKVHGLTNRALEGQPKFRDIAGKLIDFIGDGSLWFHNAPFDMGFLKTQLDLEGVSHDLKSVDSVTYFKGLVKLENYKLDTIIRHYGVKTPERKVHGALLDAAILTSAITKSKNFPDLNIEMLIDRGNEGKVFRKGVRTSKGPTPDGKAESAAKPRAQKSEPPPKKPDHRSPPNEVFTSTIEASENRGNPAVEERFRIMSVTLRTAFFHAKSFRDFMGILMKDSVSIRPHMTLGGQLDDMRFTTRGVSFTAQDFGFDMMVFCHQPTRYSRSEDAEFLIGLRDQYDKHFRASEPTAPKGGSGDADPEKAADESPVTRVNRVPPSLDIGVYAPLRVGRDEWSDKPHAEIRKVANGKMTPDMIGVFSHIEESYRLSTMRWVCRGLSPEHALCMIVSRSAAYKKPVLPEEVVSAAKGIVAGTWPPSRDEKPSAPPFRRGGEAAPKSERRKVDYKSIPIDRRVYELSMEMNTKPPSMEVFSYAMMRMGDDRDGWSSASHAEIDGYVIEILGDRRSEILPAIEDFERSTSMGLKRWICRGLSPDHALCMTVARSELYRYRVGEVAMDVARRMAGNVNEPEREP